ncbi:MAG: hypothetical protein WDW36_001766 [Sanguina aurantia]
MGGARPSPCAPHPDRGQAPAAAAAAAAKLARPPTGTSPLTTPVHNRHTASPCAGARGEYLPASAVAAGMTHDQALAAAAILSRAPRRVGEPPAPPAAKPPKPPNPPKEAREKVVRAPRVPEPAGEEGPPKAARGRSGPRSPEHRAKIAAAIQAKWKDPSYRKKTLSAIRDFHVEGGEGSENLDRRLAACKPLSGAGWLLLPPPLCHILRMPPPALARAGERWVQEEGRRKVFRLAAVRKVLAQLQKAQRVAHQAEAMVQDLRGKMEAYRNNQKALDEANAAIAQTAELLLMMRAQIHSLASKVPPDISFNQRGEVFFTPDNHLPQRGSSSSVRSVGSSTGGVSSVSSGGSSSSGSSSSDSSGSLKTTTDGRPGPDAGNITSSLPSRSQQTPSPGPSMDDTTEQRPRKEWFENSGLNGSSGGGSSRAEQSSSAFQGPPSSYDAGEEGDEEEFDRYINGAGRALDSRQDLDDGGAGEGVIDVDIDVGDDDMPHQRFNGNGRLQQPSAFSSWATRHSFDPDDTGADISGVGGGSSNGFDGLDGGSDGFEGLNGSSSGFGSEGLNGGGSISTWTVPPAGGLNGLGIPHGHPPINGGAFNGNGTSSSHRSSSRGHSSGSSGRSPGTSSHERIDRGSNSDSIHADDDDPQSLERASVQPPTPASRQETQESAAPLLRRKKKRIVAPAPAEVEQAPAEEQDPSEMIVSSGRSRRAVAPNPKQQRTPRTQLDAVPVLGGESTKRLDRAKILRRKAVEDE